VNTRIPLNRFRFSAGESIVVAGSIEMQFAEVGGRRLLFDDKSPSKKMEETKASYEVQVELADPNEMVYEVPVHSASSPKHASFRSIGILSVIVFVM